MRKSPATRDLGAPRAHRTAVSPDRPRPRTRRRFARLAHARSRTVRTSADRSPPARNRFLSPCGWILTSLDANTVIPRPLSYWGYSSARRAARASMAAWARGTATPGLETREDLIPVVLTARRGSRPGNHRSQVVAEMESQKSVTSGVSLPVRPSGPTPMIVTGCPLSRIERPTTSGSRPSRVCHAAAVTTATGAPPTTSCFRPEPASPLNRQAEHLHVARRGVLGGHAASRRHRPPRMPRTASSP